MHGRGWKTLVLAAAIVAMTTSAFAQHRPVSALNWAFGGTVHTVARAGRVAFVGGRFNAVASRHNVTGGFAVAWKWLLAPLGGKLPERALRFGFAALSVVVAAGMTFKAFTG